MADSPVPMSTWGPALGAGPCWDAGGVGRKADSLVALLTAAAGSTVLVILGFMILTTTVTALPAFRSQGISFITSTDWTPSAGRFGILGLHLRHLGDLGDRGGSRGAAQPGRGPLRDRGGATLAAQSRSPTS